MGHDVSLFPCDAYDPDVLDSVMEKAALAAGFPDVEGLTVLVKPNLLNASPPEKAVTTHPEFVAAAIRLLKRKGAARILVGDSPAWQRSTLAAATAGFLAAAKREGVAWADFKAGNPRTNLQGVAVQRFAMASVLDECDLVLNLPKLKTHRLMRYTGAVKNLFGLLPGTAKSGMHLRFPDKKRFGTMLVDLAGAVGPVFTIMDAIVAMEGEGPGSGTPRKLGLVLASKDVAALDWIAAGIIGYEAVSIPYLAEALGRTGRNVAAPGIAVGPLSPDSVRVDDFDLIPAFGDKATFMGKLPAFARSLIGQISTSRPSFDPNRCAGCSGCVRICPAHALALSKNATGKHQIRIDDSACILCYCCHEICPVRAISLRRILFRLPGRARKVDTSPVGSSGPAEREG